MDALEEAAHRRSDASHVRSQPDGALLAFGRVAFVPEFLDHLARIGPDRAVQVAQAVGGAGLVARVAEEFLHFRGAVRFLAGSFQPLDLAESGHPLARRERKPFGHAVSFAEATFHALVHDLARGRNRLEVRNVGEGIAVEDHAGVEDALRVEERLDALHQPIGLPAPFVFHERRHIAARAVLGLERAVVTVHDQFDDVVHEFLVFLHFGRRGKVLVEHEMEVAGQGVAEDHGVGVAVGGEDFAQAHGRLGKFLDREADVFDDGGGAAAAHAGHGRQHLLAELPQGGLLPGIGGEGERQFRRHAFDGARDSGDFFG